MTTVLPEKIILVAADVLRDFAAALLVAGRFAAEESARTADSLVLSDLSGYESHGVVRVLEYTSALRTGELISGAELTVQQESANTIAADGGQGLGQAQMPRFLDMLMKKTADNGVVSGALRNCGHVGRLGEWVEYIAGRGMAGFVFVNDNGTIAAVAPPGGRAGRTSTNPVAFGIPLSDGDAFTLDISTSATALGKLRLTHLAGYPCADGLIQDAQGNPTNDTNVMYEEPKGSLLPMGGAANGYKGFGLSMMVDCLVAGLSGGFTPPAPEDTPGLNNVLVTIWNPEKFCGVAHMRAEAEKYLDFVRATPPINPGHPVRIAGDGAKRTREIRRKNGIPFGESVVAALTKRARKFGVATPTVFKEIKIAED